MVTGRAERNGSFMKQNEDFDMKIASDSPGKDLRRESAPEQFTDALREQASGNLKSARVFGADMAQRMLRAQERLVPAEQDAAQALPYKVLFAFCVAAGLELYSHSTFVFRAALNAFYDRLRQTHVGLYNDLDSTGAFSFYYLAFRRGGDIAAGIGATFAMLSGREGDKALCETGTSLYNRFMKYVAGEIEAAGIGKK